MLKSEQESLNDDFLSIQYVQICRGGGHREEAEMKRTAFIGCY